MLAKRLPDDAPDIGSKANPYRTYPIFYYGRSNVSDLSWIQQRLACLPEDKLLRHKVCVEYERLYLTAKDGDRRRQANSWLDALAKQYRRSSRWER